jgi:hypothetical protein
MCFSAGASFTAGVLLTFVGTETLRKVHKPSQIALASVPVFYAAQQFTEGVLWSTIGQAGHSGLQTVSTHLFLIMAQVVWPILIPLAVLLLEENRIRKKILSALLKVGVAIGLYCSYRLIVYPVHPQIMGNHIVYQDTLPNLQGLVTIIIYLVATIAPLFVSSLKRVYLLGIIMSISFMVSALFYIRCLMSVWCFFAAIISFVIFYIVRDAHKKFHFSAHQIPKNVEVA